MRPLALVLLATCLFAQDFPCATASWDAAAYGNHRFVVRVEKASPAVRLDLPWRRRDKDPQKKDLIVLSARTGLRVTNVVVLQATRERGRLAFEPMDGPGDYFVYYLPAQMAGRTNYPNALYPAVLPTAKPLWKQQHGLDAQGLKMEAWKRLDEARLVRYEAIDAFNSFAPMGFIATEAERQALLKAHPGLPFLLFPEDRSRAIQMQTDLPARWAKGAFQPFQGEALRGETYAFQIGLYAVQSLENVQVVLEPLKGEGGTIPLTCLNTQGVDSQGRPMAPRLDVAQGRVQALWCYASVPETLPPGTYRTEASVTAGGHTRTVPLTLTVRPETLAVQGDDEPARLSRLAWLNSTLAQEGSVVKPFTPVTAKGSRLHILGRAVELAPSGLPQRIQSFFTPEMTAIGRQGQDLLAGPITFGGQAWRHGTRQWTRQTPTTQAWRVESQGEGLRLDTQATLEFDGNLEFQVKVTAERNLDLPDLALEIPLRKEAATYLLGRRGPGGMHGMASTVDAEASLGLSRLRRVRPIIRPDLYLPTRRRHDRPSA